ncbi:ABC transporter permease subunit [Adhaeretor mobilis]|uniref:ABC-2 family transporter protein n=1 Tax=Adhaeretor mobilis TaxID=1930276 RepID=A0A517MQ33_9BACT|nr:ABC transporter permease subunit [Adhaeretor mobilis]QDS96988.1 ABC-2 family transporter protein [Adhaeretor mobilis]
MLKSFVRYAQARNDANETALRRLPPADSTPMLALFQRSFAASRLLLVGCGAMLFAFIWLRVWIASQINFSSVVNMLKSGDIPDFALMLLPVSVDTLASPLGRVAFGYEELPVVLALALWAVARGSDCIAGRVGNGTMEMLLAQPLSRFTLVASHLAVSLVGVVLLGVVAWLSTAIGIATSKFDVPPEWTVYWPATINLVGIGIFLLGAATLLSAAVGSRGRAVAIMVGFYFLQIAFKIVGLLSPQFEWLKKWSFLSAYEPTLLTVGIVDNPDKYVPMFWQYNLVLVGIGLAAMALATLVFCKRDVPAPL